MNEQNRRTASRLGNESGWQAGLKAFWHRYRLTKILLLLLLSVALIFETYLYINAKTTLVGNLEQRLQVQTEVYDAEGQLAGKLSSEHGTYVKGDQISQALKDAVVTTEDKRFYQHPGFDLIGMGRAAVGYVTHGFKVVGGGSTLTQQLVKNSFLTNEQTLLRKFKELMLALEVEKHYTKDKILEMYLNHSYFGNGVYGVEDACQKYFGQSASQVGYGQAAIIAGALKGPSLYNPVDDVEATKNRRDTVLTLLENNHVLSQADAEAAMALPVPVNNFPVTTDSYQYPYYFDAVIEEAIQKYGLSEDDIMKGGYRIETNLNQAYQNTLQSIYSQPNLFPIGPSGDTAQSASVMMDPYQGGVMAVVGGNSGHSFRGFNRATQMKRQPGSTLKPLVAYTPALEAGFHYDDIVMDKVKSYAPNDYRPENHDHQTVGKLPLWQALAQSKNTTAVWLMDQVGINNAMDKLKAFGIPFSDKDLTLSTALGGLTTGASPLQLASAYTTFVNDGQRVQPQFIRRIVASDGKVVVDQVKAQRQGVTNAKIAREMSSMLLDVYNEGGTGAGMEPAGYQLAGKTGTVELSREGRGTNDEWYVAYTPDFVISSWYGFDHTDEGHYLWSDSPVRSGQNFYQIMASILPQTPNTPFTLEPASARYQAGGWEAPGGSDFGQVSEHAEDNGPSLWEQAIDGVKAWWEKIR